MNNRGIEDLAKVDYINSLNGLDLEELVECILRELLAKLPELIGERLLNFQPLLPKVFTPSPNQENKLACCKCQKVSAKVITEGILQGLKLGFGKEIEVEPKAIFTPLAMDYVKDFGLKIIRK